MIKKEKRYTHHIAHPTPTSPLPPHTYTHKTTDAADKMKSRHEIGTM